MPAWGLFVRHVKNLDLSHVEFRVAQTDLRPVAQLDDVTGVTFDTVKFPRTEKIPVVVLKKRDRPRRAPTARALPETNLPGPIVNEQL
ncbi:MAG: hypothetical protein WDM96_17140 [Lacunisphaera sp.]